MSEPKSEPAKSEKEPRRIVPPVIASRKKLAEYARTGYVVYVEAGVTPDDIQEPSYWLHHARDLKPGDHIEVICDDMTWTADLFVVSVAKTSAAVALKSITDLTKIKGVGNGDDKLRVMYRGPYHRYTIMEGETVIRPGFTTQDEAQLFLMDYRKTILKAA